MVGALKVKEWVEVLRCFRCYGLGHNSDVCKVKGMVCRKCGEEGQGIRDCKKEIEVCRNCKIAGREFGHSLMSGKCAEYVEAVSRVRERMLR